MVVGVHDCQGSSVLRYCRRCCTNYIATSDVHYYSSCMVFIIYIIAILDTVQIKLLLHVVAIDQLYLENG